MTRRTVYIAHALGPDGPAREENRKTAAKWCGFLATHFLIAPVADWIILSGQWCESEENRARGLDIDRALIEHGCQELWLLGVLLSPGMMIERDHALRLGKPVRNLVGLGFEEGPEIARRVKLGFRPMPEAPALEGANP